MKTLNLTDTELPLLRFLLSVAVDELGSRKDRALDAGAVQEYADQMRGCEALQGRLNQLEQPEKDRLADAKAQGLAQFQSICEMVEALEKACRMDANEEGGISEEAARCVIEGNPLSVEVRHSWYVPGQGSDPEEFRILLCTGGPAVQIRGELGEHNEPSKAWIEVQDWFQPWTRIDLPGGAEEILLAYAYVFYWGN
jgi:hypothetical protein